MKYAVRFVKYINVVVEAEDADEASELAQERLWVVVEDPENYEECRGIEELGE